MVPEPAAAEAPGDLLEIPVLSSHSGSTESKTLEWYPAIWIATILEGDSDASQSLRPTAINSTSTKVQRSRFEKLEFKSQLCLYSPWAFFLTYKMGIDINSTNIYFVRHFIRCWEYIKISKMHSLPSRKSLLPCQMNKVFMDLK